jgi:uncharacterized protein (TIGR02996 family)
MTPEHAFLHAIKEDPGDDGLRLILADWLEESGQADRAAFVRLQVEEARLPWEDPRRPEWQRRAQQLLVAHRDEWLGPWRRFVCEFRRGLLHVKVKASHLPADWLVARPGA